MPRRTVAAQDAERNARLEASSLDPTRDGASRSSRGLLRGADKPLGWHSVPSQITSHPRASCAQRPTARALPIRAPAGLARQRVALVGRGKRERSARSCAAARCAAGSSLPHSSPGTQGQRRAAIVGRTEGRTRSCRSRVGAAEAQETPRSMR